MSSVERRGVLIEGGIVRNIILWGDESEAQYEADGWDIAMETTDLARQPGIGWTYDETVGFRPPQPYPSWVFDGLGWGPPVAMPTEGGSFQWDEQTTSWVPIPATDEIPQPE